MSSIFFIIGIVLFVGLVVLHELGHALVAYRNGIDVEEFGVGFPPRAWSKKLKSGMLFSINWLPLGGFVKLKGEHDSAKGAGTYGASSLWVKTKVLLAGVAVNWLTAVVIFTILAFVGMPQLIDDQFTISNDTSYIRNDVVIANVVDESPASKAGLKVGDILKKINNEDISNSDAFSKLTHDYAGQTVDVTYISEGSEEVTRLELNDEYIDGVGYSGMASMTDTLRRSTWSAPIVGVGVTTQFTWMTVKGLFSTFIHLFRFEFAQAGNNVTGPVGIFSILQQTSENGFTQVLFLIGIISLTLTVMNILPIPALDGGRLFITYIFRVLKKPLTKEREEAIQSAGFLCLMALVVLITVIDVGRFFG